MYPLQAIARRAVRSKRVLIPTSEQCTAAKMTDKITCDMKTNSTIDSVPNGDSGEVQTNNHNSSSAIQGECGTDLGVNSTTDNSDSSRDPLLRKPKQHHSRNTKMFVSSQIHSGEITMQHILFTFAKDPFLKVRYIRFHFCDCFFSQVIAICISVTIC